MEYEGVPAIQSEALAFIDNQRRRGISEMAASIPHYAGPWEIAANDAEAFLTDRPESHALFVYPHERAAQAFATYVEALTGSIITSATPEKVANSNTANRFDYVAAPEDVLQAVRHRIAPRFLLRLTTEGIENPFPHTPTTEELKALGGKGQPGYDTLVEGVGLRALRELAGQKVEGKADPRREELGVWTPQDSAELYKRLAAENEGKPLTRRELEKALSQLEGKRRPTIHDMLNPFRREGDERNAFAYMQQAAGFEPARIYKRSASGGKQGQGNVY